jgi:hypothetical protein
MDRPFAAAYSPVMMGHPRNRGRWTGLGATLAAIALFMQVLVPQGFMVGGASDSGPLVICTGHGPLEQAASSSDHGAPANAPKSAGHDICLFAGHLGGLGAAEAPVLQGVVYRWTPETQIASPSLPSVRPLAAPPPPSQAPPTAV